MTTEPDDDPAKPPVIDLEAEDLSPSPKPQRQSRMMLYGVAGLAIIAAMAGGWLYKELRAVAGRVEALAVTSKDAIAEIREAAQLARQTAAALEAAGGRTAALVAEVKSGLDGRITAAEQAVQGAKADLDSLRSAATAAGNAGVDATALAAIGQRLDGLEKDVASLKAGSSPAPGSAARAALSQALSDIKAKIAAGTPYGDELARITRMVPAVAGLGVADTLARHAAQGLPDNKGLAAELRAGLASLPQPEAPAGADGYLAGLWTAIASVVTIREIGETNWPALAEDCASLAEAGDLGQAIALMDKAEGAIPTTITQWRGRAAARLKLEAAVQELGAAVESQLAALGGSP